MGGNLSTGESNQLLEMERVDGGFLNRSSWVMRGAAYIETLPIF